MTKDSQGISIIEGRNKFVAQGVQFGKNSQITVAGYNRTPNCCNFLQLFEGFDSILCLGCWVGVTVKIEILKRDFEIQGSGLLEKELGLREVLIGGLMAMVVMSDVQIAL